VKAFAELVATLDASTSTLHKVDALAAWLRAAPAADAAWAVYLLAGGKPRQAVASRLMREAARDAAGIPEWLFDESYQAVGDLAETIAHLVDRTGELDDAGLADWMTRRLPALRGAEPAAIRAALREAWSGLDWNGRFVLNKLITGGFRIGVSRLLVVRALAQAGGIDEKEVAQRMVGFTDARRAPTAQAYEAWVARVAPGGAAVGGQPYPFFLAQPLQDDPAGLGPLEGWLVEWKWDGIRAQLVLRGGHAWLWSRGEELVTERFPEIERAAREWAAGVAPGGEGVVLDGEVLAWDAAANRPLPFAALQRRVARQRLTAAVLRDAPAIFVAYDLLERGGEDLRARPQAQRRAALEALIVPTAPGTARVPEPAPAPLPEPEPASPPEPASAVLRLSPRLRAPDWAGIAAMRESSRRLGVEGLMLKRADAAYGIGRARADGADWLKWKVDPFTVDAVLIYAQRGHGRRASLYSDYTFAVWDRPRDAPGPGPRALLPFAKAYSGLTDAEIARVDAIVRRTTVESFGPVRSVTPTLVFELAFEGIAASPRHRCGIAVRFPRMLRWRTDKAIDDADVIDVLRAMLASAADRRG